MNTLGLLLGALVAISLFVSGCQPATSDQINKARNAFGYKSDQPKVETNIISIGGSWSGECVRAVEKDGFFRKDTLIITSDHMDYATEYFFDSKCTSKLYQQFTGGLFVLSGEKITVNYSNISFIPESTAALSSFLQFDGFCGYTGWKYGILMSFPNPETCGYPSKLETTIQRYGTTGGANELFLGDRKFTSQ